MTATLTTARAVYTSNTLVALSPHAPTGLTASAADSDSLKLTWNDNSTAEVGYVIESSIDNRSWDQVDILPADRTTMPSSISAKAQPNITVFEYSVPEAIPQHPVSRPGARKSLLQAISFRLRTQMTKWLSPGRTRRPRNRIQGRAAESHGSWSSVVSVASTVTTATITGLDANRTYKFRVVAFGSAGHAPTSPATAVATDTTGDLPDAPSELSSDAISTSVIELGLAG